MSSRSFEVWLGSIVVGWLSEDADQRIAFRFREDYRGLGRRPVLSQSFEDDLGRVSWGKRRDELPPFFAQLLPEGHYRELVERTFGDQVADDLGLLATLGEDLPGAVVLRAADDAVHAGASPPAPEAPNGSDASLGLRFSLAGVQLKFSVRREGDKLVLPAHDKYGDWIVKVGSTEYPGLPENEHAMLRWAQRAGFDVPDCELRELEGVPQLRRHAPPDAPVLAIRRYDRTPSTRVHQEDFTQVFGMRAGQHRKYDATYEKVASVVNALLGKEGLVEFVRRLTLVVATGNDDAHLKNWSLLYADGVTPSLTPLYDQVATVAWPQLEGTLGLKLSGTRDFGRIEMRSFSQLIQRAGADWAPDVVVMETLSRLRDAWPHIVAETRLLAPHCSALADHWQRVPLLRAAGPLIA